MHMNPNCGNIFPQTAHINTRHWRPLRGWNRWKLIICGFKTTSAVHAYESCKASFLDDFSPLLTSHIKCTKMRRLSAWLLFVLQHEERRLTWMWTQVREEDQVNVPLLLQRKRESSTSPVSVGNVDIKFYILYKVKLLQENYGKAGK